MSQNPITPPGIGDDLRTLRRSRSDRMVAGVLGGLGARLGIDPLVLRIITAVLAIFGGVGIVLYAVGWLLIPAEDEETSIAENALGRGTPDARTGATICLAVCLALVALITAGGSFGSGVGTVLLLLAVIGFIAVLRRRDDDDDDLAPEAPPAHSIAPEHPGYPGYPGYVPSSDFAAETPGDSPTTPAAEMPAEPFPAPSEGTGWPEGPDWWTEPEDPYQPVAAPVAAPPEPRERSYLGVLTLCTAVVALGVLAINDATWASIPMSAYLATALAVIGLGLLVGTWFGRARKLIGWGVVVSLLLLPATIIGDGVSWRGEDTTVLITEQAELPTSPQDHGQGRVVYDLSELDLDDTDEFALEISQNAGKLTVIVPPEADVTVTANNRLGAVELFGDSWGGFRTIREAVDLGPDGAGGGSLSLDLSLMLGQIEVTR
jgi:phage shock protein PspC (stress-responsive transcriptional regulator)